MAEFDSLLRFTFPVLGVRGEFVRLDRSWQTVRATHDYPDAVAAELGRGLAAVALLSATIKFEGSLIMQLQGSGPIRTLVAQATDRRTVRGMARWEGDVPDTDLTGRFGSGQLVLTARAPGGEQYQGIVPLEGRHLGNALETYFAQSEQLPSRFWLSADNNGAAGLFLQRLPGGEGDADGWNRVTQLAGTVTDSEMLTLDPEQLLVRLFHEEEVRLHEKETIRFACGCSRDRIGDALRSLGRPEVEGILRDEGKVQVDCEFCNARYEYDAVDVEVLFQTGRTGQEGQATRH